MWSFAGVLWQKSPSVSWENWKRLICRSWTSGSGTSALQDGKANERMGEIKGASCFDWSKMPPLTYLCSILNSRLLWECGVFSHTSPWNCDLVDWIHTSCDGGRVSPWCLQVCFCGSSKMWNIKLRVIWAGVDVLVWHWRTNLLTQVHVEPTRSQNYEGWHLTSSWNVQDWWRQKMIYGQMKGVLATGRWG